MKSRSVRRNRPEEETWWRWGESPEKTGCEPYGQLQHTINTPVNKYINHTIGKLYLTLHINSSYFCLCSINIIDIIEINEITPALNCWLSGLIWLSDIIFHRQILNILIIEKLRMKWSVNAENKTPTCWIPVRAPAADLRSALLWLVFYSFLKLDWTVCPMWHCIWSVICFYWTENDKWLIIMTTVDNEFSYW